MKILSLVEVSNILLTIICHTLAHVSSTKHDMNIKHFCSRANSSAVSKVQTLLHKICNLKYFYILYLYIIDIYCFPKEKEVATLTIYYNCEFISCLQQLFSKACQCEWNLLHNFLPENNFTQLILFYYFFFYIFAHMKFLRRPTLCVSRWGCV